jgi:hypothetical protein
MKGREIKIKCIEVEGNRDTIYEIKENKRYKVKLSLCLTI